MLALCWMIAGGLRSESARDFSRPDIRVRRTDRGFFWEWDGGGTSFLNGMVYQPVPKGRHVDDYIAEDDYHRLYRALLPAREDGRGHAAELEAMGVDFIRVYRLGVTDERDVEKVKALFRRIHAEHGIRVLLGHWAGLHDDPNDEPAIRRSIERTVDLYGGEPWLLALLLGNENNYFHNGGILRNENTPEDMRIELSAADYFDFMGRMARAARERFRRIGVEKPVGLGCGEISPPEFEPLIRNQAAFDFIGYNSYRSPDRLNDYLAVVKKRGLALPLLITECGIPAGGTGLWGIRGFRPFDANPPSRFDPVVPEDGAPPVKRLSAVQKNYWRGLYAAAARGAAGIVDDPELRARVLESGGDAFADSGMTQIFVEALYLKGLSERETGNFERAAVDFRLIVERFGEITLWNQPLEPLSREERERVYWNIVETGRRHSAGRGTGNVIGVCCFEFTDQHWNDVPENAGFHFSPAAVIRNDRLLEPQPAVGSPASVS
jgi:hypothetical protein